jgi:dTDP-glucose pyrophosphorylase
MKNSEVDSNYPPAIKLDDIIISSSTTIIKTIEILNKTHQRIVLVANKDRKLLGVVSDANVRRAVLNKTDFKQPVSEIMANNPITAHENTTNAEVRTIMERTQIYEIPIIDDDGYIVDLKVINDILRTDPTTDLTAVIMVGGLGSRLKPLTNNTPKPLLEVGGIPILFILLDQLLSEKFTRIYLTLNYKAEEIRKAVDAEPRFSDVIHYVYEEKRLGTAGALKLLPIIPKKPFLVLNGDLLTKVAMGEMVRFHEFERNLMTVALKKERFNIPYGCAEVEGTRILKMEEKPDHTAFINAGVYVIDPIILQNIPEDTFFDMTNVIDQVLDSGLRAGFFPVHEYWLDIGQHSQLEQARSDYGKYF